LHFIENFYLIIFITLVYYFIFYFKGCNVEISIGNESYANSYSAFKEKVKNSTVIEVDGQKIGIIGYVLGEFGGQHWPGRTSIRYNDRSECLTREIENLRNQNVSLIVAIFSMSITKARNLLKNIDGVDVAVIGSRWDGGDIKEYIGKTLVVKAQNYGKSFHELSIKVNTDGNKAFEDNILPLDKTVPNGIIN